MQSTKQRKSSGKNKSNKNTCFGIGDDDEDYNKLDENSKALFNLLNKKLNNLESKFEGLSSSLSEKVTELEDRVVAIEESALHQVDSIIHEINDRQSRANNIIIYNLCDSKDAAKNDFQRLQQLLSRCDGDLPFDINSVEHQRLGNKFINGKSRPLRVTLPSKNHVHWIFSQKKNIIDGSLGISGDLTKNQRAYRASIIKELKRRKSDGETNLFLKYVKGSPTIAVNDNAGAVSVAVVTDDTEVASAVGSPTNSTA